MSIEIDEKSNKVVIGLNKDLYDIDSIKNCAEDFSRLCTAKVRSNGKVRVILEAKGEADISTLGHEFCNYLLAFMKNNNKV